MISIRWRRSCQGEGSLPLICYSPHPLLLPCSSLLFSSLLFSSLLSSRSLLFASHSSLLFASPAFFFSLSCVFLVKFSPFPSPPPLSDLPHFLILFLPLLPLLFRLPWTWAVSAPNRWIILLLPFHPSFSFSSSPAFCFSSSSLPSSLPPAACPPLFPTFSTVLYSLLLVLLLCSPHFT